MFTKNSLTVLKYYVLSLLLPSLASVSSLFQSQHKKISDFRSPSYTSPITMYYFLIALKNTQNQLYHYFFHNKICF